MTSPRYPRPVLPGVRLVLVALLALATFGCGVSDPAGGGGGGGSADGFDPATTELSVSFGAASIPDPRSYELTVEDQEAHVVVTSGQGIVHDETVPIPDDVWEPFVADLGADLDRVGDTEVVGDGCTGGTTFRVEVTSGDREFRRDVDNCGSDRNGEIVDQLEATLAPVFDAVDLDRLLERD